MFHTETETYLLTYLNTSSTVFKTCFNIIDYQKRVLFTDMCDELRCVTVIGFNVTTIVPSLETISSGIVN